MSLRVAGAFVLLTLPHPSSYQAFTIRSRLHYGRMVWA
jgi:hypothetical protein